MRACGDRIVRACDEQAGRLRQTLADVVVDGRNLGVEDFWGVGRYREAAVEDCFDGLSYIRYLRCFASPVEHEFVV